MSHGRHPQRRSQEQNANPDQRLSDVEVVGQQIAFEEPAEKAADQERERLLFDSAVARSVRHSQRHRLHEILGDLVDVLLNRELNEDLLQ